MNDFITMNALVDFALSCGTGRVIAARNAQDTPPIFYAPVLATIAHMHQNGLDAAVLDDLLTSLVDPREKRIFPKVVTSYKKFLRSGRMTWFEPPLRDWPLGPLTVRVAPDLGLLIDGRPHAIKLHFGGAPIEPQRAMFFNHLLGAALGPTWPGAVFAVLDVRRAQLIAYRPKRELKVLLRAEAGCLSALIGGLS